MAQQMKYCCQRQDLSSDPSTHIQELGLQCSYGQVHTQHHTKQNKTRLAGRFLSHSFFTLYLLYQVRSSRLTHSLFEGSLGGPLSPHGGGFLRQPVQLPPFSLPSLCVFR